MFNEPSKERLAKIPRLFETESIPLADKLIYLHFHIFRCDWYISEYDGDDIFWGHVVLHTEDNSEWGYISFRELKAIKIRGWLEVNCETERTWKIRKASEIERIKLGGKFTIA